MKCSHWLLLLAVPFSLHVLAQKEIKIVSYTILEGLGNVESYGEGKLGRCVKWLQDQNADVIARQELYESEELLSADAREWEHNYYVKAASIGLSSKEPIQLVKKYKTGFWHGVLHCKTYGIGSSWSILVQKIGSIVCVKQRSFE